MVVAVGNAEQDDAAGSAGEPDVVRTVRAAEQTGALRLAALVASPRVHFVAESSSEREGASDGSAARPAAEPAQLPLSFASMCNLFQREAYCSGASATLALCAPVALVPAAASCDARLSALSGGGGGGGDAAAFTRSEEEVAEGTAAAAESEEDEGGGWDERCGSRAWGDADGGSVSGDALTPVAEEFGDALRAAIERDTALEDIARATAAEGRAISELPRTLAALFFAPLRPRAGCAPCDETAVATLWQSLSRVFVSGSSAARDMSSAPVEEGLLAGAARITSGECGASSSSALPLSPVAAASIAALFARWLLAEEGDAASADGAASGGAERFAHRLLGASGDAAARSLRRAAWTSGEIYLPLHCTRILLTILLAPLIYCHLKQCVEQVRDLNYHSVPLRFSCESIANLFHANPSHLLTPYPNNMVRCRHQRASVKRRASSDFAARRKGLRSAAQRATRRVPRRQRMPQRWAAPCCARASRRSARRRPS